MTKKQKNGNKQNQKQVKGTEAKDEKTEKGMIKKPTLKRCCCPYLTVT